MFMSKWEAPLSVWIKAIVQWGYVGFVAFVLWLLTFFPMGPLMILFARPGTNIFGESIVKHSQKYIDQGSSGVWKFVHCDLPILKYWSNLEDGLLGEPSGKHSARVGGKEETFWNKYQWTIRNPFNYLKRTTRFFACYVNDCTIKYWGDRVVSDKNLDSDGSYLIMAVDRTTEKVYYGYRKVVHFDSLGWYLKLKDFFRNNPRLAKYSPMLENKVFQATFGYKVKPTHDSEVQDADDLDKAFTFRIQFWANAN